MLCRKKKGKEGTRCGKLLIYVMNLKRNYKYVASLFGLLGKKEQFHGKIATVKVKDDNVLVKEGLQTLPEGTVLVVDGGASTNCALLGDNLAAIAEERKLAGIIVNGYVRDSSELKNINIGILALGTMPNRSVKEGKRRTKYFIALWTSGLESK